MIIKPSISGRIFWGVTGFTMLILSCGGIGVPFPGIFITCLSFPLAVFALGYTFGIALTRLDDEGIFQRNFFFISKKLLWNEIQRGEIVSEDYNYTDNSGWTSRRTRTNMTFIGKDKKIHINVDSSGPENWWEDLRTMAKEKLGERFDG
jgi:hypothetical protein